MPKKSWWTSPTKLFLLSLFYCSTISVAWSTGNATGDVMDFSSGSNLTDQEKVTSETYVHQGLTQEKIDEGCKTDKSKDTDANRDENQAMRDACNNRERHLIHNLVPMVIKASAVVIGAGLGGEYEVTKTSSAGASTEAGAGANAGGSNPSTTSGAAGQQQGGQQQQQQKEKRQDYCRYVAMATEALSMFQQMAAQQNLSSTAGSSADPNAQFNQQRENLYRAKRSHEERATTAKIQSGGWGATAACYTITILSQWSGGATGLAGGGDWANLLLKLGLSTFAAIYYGFEAAEQEKYAKKIGEVIASLPQAGECNPVTERHCFCSQPSSIQDTGNFMKYCAPQIRGQQLAANGLKVSCVDGKGQADPECQCRNSNSCFDVEFMNMIGGLKFGKTPEEALGRDVRDLSRGNLSSGDLRSGQFGGAQASRIKNLLRGLDISKAPKAPPLGPNQGELADLAGQFGLPRSVASIALNSKNPPNLAQFAGKVKSYEVDPSVFNSLRDGNAKILTFSGGMGPGKKSAGNSNQFDLNKLLKKKDGPSGGGEQVLKFAERASESAQINKNPDTGIFDIISYRYRASGWKRVNVE